MSGEVQRPWDLLQSRPPLPQSSLLPCARDTQVGAAPHRLTHQKVRGPPAARLQECDPKPQLSPWGIEGSGAVCTFPRCLAEVRFYHQLFILGPLRRSRVEGGWGEHPLPGCHPSQPRVSSPGDTESP